MKDKKFESSNIKKASAVGLYIGIGLFLAFPLPKIGWISDIVAGFGFIVMLIYYSNRIRKKKLYGSKDHQGGA